MKKVFLVIIMACTIFAGYASDKEANEKTTTTSSGEMAEVYTVKGTVTDLAGELLAGVTVQVNGKKVFTDLDGKFVVPGVCKDCRIQVNMISYQPQTVSFDAAGQKELKIALKQ